MVAYKFFVFFLYICLGANRINRSIDNSLHKQDILRQICFYIHVRPYKLLSKYPTGKGLGKCSLKNLSSPDLSERETGRGV